MTHIILYSLITGAFLLLSFLLFGLSLKRNNIANKWLSIFALTLGLTILEIVITLLDDSLKDTIFLDSISVCRFITGPSLYLGALFFTHINKTLRLAHFLHFLPALFFLALRVFVRLSGIEFDNQVQSILFPLISLSLPVQYIFYWLACFYLILKHQKNIRLFSADVNKIDLRWMYYLLYSTCAILLTSLFVPIFDIKIGNILPPILYLIATYVFSYFALAQTEIFNFKSAELAGLNQLFHPTTTAKRFTDSQLKHLKSTLDQTMDHKKLFLNNELSLPMLADEIGLSIHDASYLINNAYHTNFYTFINDYRIAEFKKLIMEHKHGKLQMMDLAVRAGFNSKTVFNASFKKNTGMSPSEYLKSISD